MDTRREFLKKAAMLSGGAGLAGMLPESIQRAFAINPPVGSTYLDAEHVVILMQENRSFDHCYGTLQGVRGFNDPRAIKLPNKNTVWLQTNAAGETYLPFRLNIKDTKATWMGSLPHSWTDQVDARNGGKYDQWLIAKRSGHKDYRNMPLTLGYYNREDIPFYYSLADAFTVCDQNFCSSLTGTTPNRLYLWTGTIRDQILNAYANVRNENVDYDKTVRWKTFPERLEENNISWRIYQNELSVGAGFEGEEDAWLGNFTDNPIEWFDQYHVKFSEAYIDSLPKQIRMLSEEIRMTEEKLTGLAAGDEGYGQAERRLQRLKHEREIAESDRKVYTRENYAKLSQREKNLHEKAFTTNKKDPFYHQLTSLEYQDGSTTREVKIPKGDVLHQFREDVKNGNLPTVSWLVAPENFSDHPGAPWYGAWYVSEALDILTRNPEVWKKTIFILAYDENDGYFDHVPPFTVPEPGNSQAGSMSGSIDGNIEYVTLKQDMERKDEKNSRASSIGLGYRVPLVIASPWSRGGAVCSEVFDHTSTLQFLEKFLTHKTGKKIEETNISAWRRAVCGDLTSTFKPYNGEDISLPPFLSKDDFIESVHKAKFKQDVSGFRPLTDEEVTLVNNKPGSFSLMPQQEKGVRPACALPYQLYANGKLSANRKSFEISFQASDEVLGKRAAGSPFNVYAPVPYQKNSTIKTGENWSYAVAPGDTVADSWPLNAFEENRYHLCVYGPNGFYREFRGTPADPLLNFRCEYETTGKKITGNLDLRMSNVSNGAITVVIEDHSYGYGRQTKVIPANGQVSFIINLAKSFRWYDFSVTIKDIPGFEQRYAGRVETGEQGYTDPYMGKTVA